MSARAGGHQRGVWETLAEPPFTTTPPQPGPTMPLQPCGGDGHRHVVGRGGGGRTEGAAVGDVVETHGGLLGMPLQAACVAVGAGP